MNIESNPASRLHTLLTDLLQGDPNGDVFGAWARVLDVTERHDIEVPRRLVLLNDLLDDAEQSIKLNPALNHKRYLACFPQIRAVLTPSQISARVNELVIPQLTPDVMTRLEFCAEALQQGWSEVEITLDDLQAISNDLNALVELVAASSIDIRLRRALLEALEGVRLSVSLYRIFGAKGLKKNFQGLFGLAFTERTALKNEGENNPDLIERLGELLNKVDSVVATGLKVHKVLFKSLLSLIGLGTESGPSSSDQVPP
jgi:hypothetical protein